MANGNGNGKFSWREIAIILTVVGGTAAGIWTASSLYERLKIAEERIGQLEASGSRPLERMGEHVDRLDERMDTMDKRMDDVSRQVIQLLTQKDGH